MKRIYSRLLMVMVVTGLLCGSCLAAGSCIQTGLTDNVGVVGEIQRKYITLTCTGDGSITAYSFDPAPFGVRGWYLYNVTTNPGTSSPTAAYDITLVSDGEDVAGGLLADRSATATETVAISPTTKGYHLADKIIAITFADNSANPSTIVMTLRFTSN